MSVQAKEYDTRERLLDSARAMIPALLQRADATEENRSILKETLHEIRQAGLVRVLQPKRWGGLELPLQDQADIAIALGQGEMSTAWVYDLYSSHAYHLALFDDRAQKEVWSENEDAFIASAYSPSGHAKTVAGGYRLSGRWKYSSGSNDSDWVIVGGIASDRPYDGVNFLLPRSDYQVIDTWRSWGLKGSGSNDILVEDVFVPAHRTHAFADGFACKNPGTNQGPLYQIPFLQVFHRAITYAAIGGLQAMHDEFIKYAAAKTGSFGGRAATDPDAQYAAGIALNTVHEIQTLLRADLARLMESGTNGVPLSIPERLGLRYRASHVPERCVEAARLMLEASGGGSLYETLPFGRAYRNLTAARQHHAVQHRHFARTVGSHLLGIPNEEIAI